MKGARYFVSSGPEVVEQDGLFQLVITSGEASQTYVLTPYALTALVGSGKRAVESFQRRKLEGATPLRSSGRKRG